MNMLEGHGKTETYKQVQKATDLGGLERAAAAMQADPGFAQPYRVPMALEPAPDLLREAVSNPVNAWRPVCLTRLEPQRSSLEIDPPLSRASPALDRSRRTCASSCRSRPCSRQPSGPLRSLARPRQGRPSQRSERWSERRRARPRPRLRVRLRIVRLWQRSCDRYKSCNRNAR